MLLQKEEKVNTAVAAMQRLRERLLSGGYERCACCLNWFTGKGGVCVHIPSDYSFIAPYCLCAKCAGKAASSGQAQARVFDKVHTYIYGGAA
jgi:hypothetical protein